MQLVKNRMIAFRTQVYFFRKRGNEKRGKKRGEGARGEEEEGRGRKEARKRERREGMSGAEEEGKHSSVTCLQTERTCCQNKKSI